MNNEKMLFSMGSYVVFLENLKENGIGVDEIPLTEGKWSIKQIISHMYRWDLFLLEAVLPAGLKDKAVHFPSHDEYNAQSEVYSNTISFKTLINHSVDARKKLIEKLAEHQKLLGDSITINGLTHCPNTGKRYSLNYLMTEFVHHDMHHSQQIEQFLTLNHAK
ncbi:DinB family protein [Bacillus salacetis]|uniref:DinB family protein n=1 Tax=Bacillus salacetis TaxID=2315464 RepID=UPI003BA3DD94